MDAVDLFAVALNLPSPWHISQVEFKPSKESSLELHIYIAFQRGGRFPCPQEPCGKSFPAYDTAPRTWRHLNFFQYKTCIHADLPRIFQARTHEKVLRHTPQPLGGNPALLRASIHQCDSGRTEQLDSEHQASCARFQE